MTKTSKYAVAAGMGATLALGLIGCSGKDAPQVSGLRDDVKFKAYVAEKSHTERQAKTKNVCSGTGQSRKCSDKADGFKVVKVIDQAAKPALYCVELDDVNGKPNDDDRWYEVTSAVYGKWADANEGAKVVNMEYSASGCAQ